LARYEPGFSAFVPMRPENGTAVAPAATVRVILAASLGRVEAACSAYTEAIQRSLDDTSGDDAQLANVDLQNILQKQQQALQMMSNISKLLFDTAAAIIRKIGG